MKPYGAMLTLNPLDHVVGFATHFLAALPRGQLSRGLIGIAVAFELLE